MAEYIDKAYAIVAIRNLYPDMPRIRFNGNIQKWRETYDDFIRCETEIEKIEPADVVPVRRGKWVRGNWHIRCSECGEDYPFMTPNYCPNCGARMEKPMTERGIANEP